MIFIIIIYKTLFLQYAIEFYYILFLKDKRMVLVYTNTILITPIDLQNNQITCKYYK